MEDRKARHCDPEAPVDRCTWFRRRAIDAVGSKAFEARGLDPESGGLKEVTLLAAVASGVTSHHAFGLPLGQILDWAGERLGEDIDQAYEVAMSAYRHFRSGRGVPGLVWTPSLVYRAMLTWFLSQTGESGDESVTEVAHSWLFDEDEAAEMLSQARSWAQLEREPFIDGVEQLRASQSRVDRQAALGQLPAIARTSGALRTLTQDLALVRTLQGDGESVRRQLIELEVDVLRRLNALTVMERELLDLSAPSPAAIGWAQHRNAIFRAHELRTKGRTVMALMNAVCERVGDTSLIPDWLEEAVFNGRYLAGIAPGGPTATAWILPSDLEDFSTLQLDVDLEPNTEERASPPALAVYWRDGTRSPDDWSWVSLLIRDHPEAWSWLAVLAITGRMKIDVIATDGDGNLDLVSAGLVDVRDSLAAWLDRFPDPPENVSQALRGIADDHAVGGLQAAERSKSYDILDLSIDEAADSELVDARREVLDAESRRADCLWGQADFDDAEVARSWSRFQEMKAWRHGKRVDKGIDRERWLSDLTAGIATQERAIVHMMVDEGLTLFWAAGGGTRRDSVATPAPVHRLLASLEPWSRNASLRPRGDADPVREMMAEAEPVADALSELAREQKLDHLVLVPWRGLHCVPWGAVSLSDGTPLRERVRITHAPAIRMLRRSLPAQGDNQPVAIAAHGSTLERADAEVELISRIRGGTVVEDGTASQRIVRAMTTATVLHVAGHAAVGPHPFAAALLAGTVPLDPTQITSSARIHAHADLSGCQLVMINTCNSGRYAPRARTFENHTGLDAACLCVGAAMVISTLWPVNDWVATIVAAVTHWHLAGGSSPSVALEQAIAVLRDGQGPSGIPAALRPLLDEALTSTWQDQLEARAPDLRHPYWWAAWRISGADWLLD
jgi:CHAT domain